MFVCESNSKENRLACLLQKKLRKLCQTNKKVMGLLFRNRSKTPNVTNQLIHGLRTPGEEITFTARLKINSHSKIFWYGRSIFYLPHRPKFSIFFDLCLYWVSVLRDLINQINTCFFTCLLKDFIKKIRKKSERFKRFLTLKIRFCHFLKDPYSSFQFQSTYNKLLGVCGISARTVTNLACLCCNFQLDF